MIIVYVITFLILLLIILDKCFPNKKAGKVLFQISKPYNINPATQVILEISKPTYKES
jgi:uncharacterized protein YggT (Ycf19 family)